MKKNKNIITIIVVIIVLLIAFIVCKKVLFNANNPKVVSLTIDSFRINEEIMDNRLSVLGTIDLSLDDDLYEGVSLDGYCLDVNNKKYNIHGPQDGRALFHNGSSELSLSEVLDETKDVEWDNITIKYCKVDKMNAFPADNAKAKKEIKFTEF